MNATVIFGCLRFRDLESCENKESLCDVTPEFRNEFLFSVEENEPTNFSNQWAAKTRRFEQSENWLIEC